MYRSAARCGLATQYAYLAAQPAVSVLCIGMENRQRWNGAAETAATTAQEKKPGAFAVTELQRLADPRRATERSGRPQNKKKRRRAKTQAAF